MTTEEEIKRGKKLASYYYEKGLKAGKKTNIKAYKPIKVKRLLRKDKQVVVRIKMREQEPYKPIYFKDKILEQERKLFLQS